MHLCLRHPSLGPLLMEIPGLLWCQHDDSGCLCPETCWGAGAFGDVTGSRWPTRQGGCLLPRSGSGGWSSPGGRSVGAIWQVFLLLVEDIFEEVDVVAEEEQGKLSL